MKRIFLFLATNLAIMLVLSITMRVLGVEPYLTAQGLNLGSLLIFAAVFGMGGAFISLAISKWTAKRSVGAVVIENPAHACRNLAGGNGTSTSPASRYRHARKWQSTIHPKSTHSPPA